MEVMWIEQFLRRVNKTFIKWVRLVSFRDGPSRAGYLFGTTTTVEVAGFAAHAIPVMLVPDPLTLKQIAGPFNDPIGYIRRSSIGGFRALALLKGYDSFYRSKQLRPGLCVITLLKAVLLLPEAWNKRRALR